MGYIGIFWRFCYIEGFGLVGLGGLRMCIFNKILCDVDVVGCGLYFENFLVEKIFLCFLEIDESVFKLFLSNKLL